MNNLALSRQGSIAQMQLCPFVFASNFIQLSLCAKSCSVASTTCSRALIFLSSTHPFSSDVFQGQLFIFAEFSTAVSEQQSTLILFSVHVYFTWLSLLHHDPVSTHILNRCQVERWQGEVFCGGGVFVGLWQRKCDPKIKSCEYLRSKFLKRIV